MKKSLFIATALLALAACTREMDVNLPAGDMTITARTETSMDTKTIVEGETHVYWEPGDEIAVFSGEKSAKFTTDITESSATATFHGSLGKTNGADLWAVYPYSSDAVFDGEAITTTLPFEQVARYGSFGKDMNLSIARSSSDKLQFYNVGGGIRFRLTQEGIKKVTFEGYGGEILTGTVKIGLDENGLPVIKEVTDGSTVITLLPPSGNDSFPTNVWFFCVAIPGSLASGYKLEFYRESEYSRKASEKAVTIKRSIFGSIDNADEGCEFIPIPNTIVPVPDIIDMGLSVKWASFNLGATNPEESGDYYAWGETEPKDVYWWNTYKWCLGTSSTLTKYCPADKTDYWDGEGAPDGITVLDPEDDAAHVNLGGNWRMPTYAECRELMENCTWTWITQNGVNGMLVTASNGNSIFLPATGDFWETDLIEVGVGGGYWSSTLYTYRPYCAFMLAFADPEFTESYSYTPEDYFGRGLGLTVRPVYDDGSSVPPTPIPDPVDMGLSVKWASFNLGATKPEEYGDYYAWGETEPYYSSLNPLIWKDGKESGYSWLSYKWCMGAYNQLTKYCYDSHTGYNGYTDDRTVLDIEDDAVRANWGGNWRMPTDAEWTELRENCAWTWTTQNRVNGYQVTASNGNSIFLPATGNYHEDILNSASQIGYYWSTALYVNHTPSARDDDGVPYNNHSGAAWGVYFASNHVSWLHFERREGFSIRPVRE